VNHKRVYRLYVEEKLGLRRKRGRRRMPTTAARVPENPNPEKVSLSLD